MKIKLALSHSDTVSGTWIMDDGTKCYWSEGRSSWINCIRPDGSCEDLPAALMAHDWPEADQELVACLIEAMENGPCAEDWRAMAPHEEAEHEAVHNS